MAKQEQKSYAVGYTADSSAVIINTEKGRVEKKPVYKEEDQDESDEASQSEMEASSEEPESEEEKPTLLERPVYVPLSMRK